MKLIQIVLLLLFSSILLSAQTTKIPSTYSNIKYDSTNRLYYSKDGKRYYAFESEDKYSIKQLLGSPVGTNRGIILDFKGFKGSITYGMITYGLAPHPLPVYRFTEKILGGKASINIIRNFSYPFDFVNWKENKKLTIGYRLIDETGMIVFDGNVSVAGSGPFKVVPTIYEGPYINRIKTNSVVIWFNTSSLKSKES